MFEVLPLVNTILLLSSGVTITLAHRAILAGDNNLFKKALWLTVILGLVFLCCQCIEYKYGVLFAWNENIYGSVFFVITGFHGFHVTIGTIFLLFCLIRAIQINFGLSHLFSFFGRVISCSELTRVFEIINYNWNLCWGTRKFNSFTKDQHLGFEAAAWYWHFVDVVWIFLFINCLLMR